jgi:uncharacterized protein
MNASTDTTKEMTEIAAPGPERDALNSPYWDSLAKGVLSFQRCNACQHAWLPARSECPHCLAGDWRWTPASGGAKLISWVVYHMSYHPAFANRLPYTVAVVELDEGPRMISNLLKPGDPESLKIDQRLRLVIEDEGGTAVPRFVLA